MGLPTSEWTGIKAKLKETTWGKRLQIGAWDKKRRMYHEAFQQSGFADSTITNHDDFKHLRAIRMAFKKF